MYSVPLTNYFQVARRFLPCRVPPPGAWKDSQKGIRRLMSIKVMSAVWELELPLTDKFILLAFADHADDAGFCFPSYRRISWKCGVSEDTIKRAVARLKTSGILSLLTPGIGRGHSQRFQVNPERGRRLHPFSAPLPDLKGGQRAAKGGATTPIKGGTALPPESSLEPSINRKATPAQISRAKADRQSLAQDIQKRIDAGQFPPAERKRLEAKIKLIMDDHGNRGIN